MDDLALGVDVLAITRPPAGAGCHTHWRLSSWRRSSSPARKVLQAPASVSAQTTSSSSNWDTTHNVMQGEPERVLGLLKDVAAELP
ncbi:MAG: hypothetical protein ACR2NR_03900 [Solirubrobacteraceae bacterium]